MHLDETFPLQEIKQHLFSKIAIISSLYLGSEHTVVTVISGNMYRSLEDLRG